MNTCDIIYNNYLAHFGILGMKWGVRRYQNKDGALTEAGKKRYSNAGYNKEKAERESRILKRWVVTPQEWDRLSEKEQQETVDVFNDVRNKSYDWYEGKTHSEGQKRYTKRYEELYDKRHTLGGNKLSKEEVSEIYDLMDKISSQALKDIGFEDTEEAREIVWKMMEWD